MMHTGPVTAFAQPVHIAPPGVMLPLAPPGGNVVVSAPVQAQAVPDQSLDYMLGQSEPPGMPSAQSKADPIQNAEVRGIFCVECGTKNDVDGDGVADGKFCNGCGSELAVKE
jgi:hypothetical protein